MDIQTVLNYLPRPSLKQCLYGGLAFLIPTALAFWGFIAFRNYSLHKPVEGVAIPLYVGFICLYCWYVSQLPVLMELIASPQKRRR